MTDIGYATLQIIPSAQGFSSALRGEVQSSGVSAAAEEGGQSLGGRVMGGAAKMLKIGTMAVVGIGTAVAGLAIKGGIARQLQIEDATAKLDGLGHSTDAVKTIMDSAMASVKGTAFGMGDAATLAAGAVAAGIAPGEELTRILKLTGDAATIAGMDLADMGDIFNTVAANNKLSGEEVAQLQGQGIPILKMIAEQYGVTQEAAGKLVADGKVQFSDFADIIETNLGGAALKSGDTTRGALANMNAAFSRFGVMLTEGFFPLAKNVFSGIMNVVDGLTAILKPFTQAWGEAFQAKAGPAIDAFAENVLTKLQAVGAAFTLIQTGDFTAEIREALGVEEDSKLVDVLFRVREAVAATKAAFSLFTTGEFTSQIREALGGAEEDSPIVATILSLRQAFADFNIGDFLTIISPVGAVLKGLAPVLPIVADAVLQVGMALGEALGGALEAIMPVMPVVADAILQIGTALTGALAAVLPTVVELLGSLAAMMAENLVAILPTVSALIQTVADVFVALLPVLLPVIDAIAAGLSEALTAIMPVLLSLAQVLGEALMAILPVLVPIIGTLADVLVLVIEAIVPLIPPILDLVMAFLPLLPVVAELIATLLPPLVSLIVALLPPIVSLVSGVLGRLIPALTGIVTVVVTVITWISNLVVAFVGLFTGATDLSGKLSGVWDSIKNASTKMWDSLVSFVSAVPGRLVSGLSSLGTSVKNTVVDAFTSAKNGASNVLDSLVDMVKGIPGKVTGALGNLGSLLYNSGKDMIQGLLNGAGSLLSTIGSFFLSKLPGWIQGPFKSAMGIHSPSKVFAGYGVNLGEGIIVGAESMKDEIGDSMEDLVTVPNAAAFASPTSAAGAGLASTLAASLSMPSVLEVRDVDGDLVGRMQVEAGRVQEGAVTPLHLGRSSW